MLTKAFALALALAVGAHAAAADPGAAAAGTDRKFINGERSAAQTPPPISDAVLVGNTLYISGHLSVDPKTGQVPADPQAEAKLVMDRVKRTVESAGLTMDDVVSMQVFCTDLALFDTFNSVYRTYFPHGFPARAFLGAGALLRGAHFEVLGVAVRRPGKP
jgi:2-iminobutanoate/2-iminopropanoate deaminase